MINTQLFDLSTRVALVTGSSRGIGRAIALALAEYGAAVAVHGTKHSDALDQTLADVKKLSPRSAAIVGELSRPEAATKIVNETASAIGAPDILVANASIQFRKPWADVMQAEAEQQMQVNFHATLRMIQAAAPAMRANKWGRIVTVGSVQQVRPLPEMIVYAASKAAQENLVRNLAKQLAPDGITVNNLAPGAIATDRNEAVLADETYRRKVLAVIPAGYVGEPRDCAGAALLLCSEAGRYITGQDLYVDGGMGLP